MTPTVHVAESTHYYDREGRPAYEVPAKNGQPRPTTLRDARKLDLVPSVTTILKCAAAPGLVNWQIDQGILAALTLPRGGDEAEDDWLVRVKRDSQEQGRAAAEQGTTIHAAIEELYRDGIGGPYSLDEDRYTAAMTVQREIAAWFGADVGFAPEQSFASTYGFGGKADLLHREPGDDILLDIKTKAPWPEDYPPKGFDEHCMQLAAYRVGLGIEAATCANVFCSRQAPWQVHIHEWTEEELQRGWVMFRNLLWFWCAKNNFDPSWEEDTLERAL